MHGEIYKLVESLENVIGRYPVEDLRTLGLELRRHAEKKDLNPFEELVLRRVGGMILEAHKVRQQHLVFVKNYMYGYESYPTGLSKIDEVNYRIKTLMAIGQGAFGNGNKGKRIKRKIKKSASPTPYVDYLAAKTPGNLGNDAFKYLVKAGYVIATDEHMIATFASDYCKSKTIAKAKALLAEYGYPVN